MPEAASISVSSTSLFDDTDHLTKILVDAKYSGWLRSPLRNVPIIAGSATVFYHPSYPTDNDAPQVGQRGWQLGREAGGGDYTVTLVELRKVPWPNLYPFEWAAVHFEDLDGKPCPERVFKTGKLEDIVHTIQSARSYPM